MSTHLRLLSFLGPYKKQVVFAWLVVAMTAVTTMIMPQLLRWAIDTGLKPTYTSLDASISETIGLSDTQLVVENPQNLTVDETIRIDEETMKVVAISGDNVTVERGFDGSREAVHDSGDEILRADPTYLGETSTLTKVALLILGIAVLRGFFTYWSSSWRMAGSARRLRPAQPHLRKLQRLSYAYHDQPADGADHVARHAGRGRRRVCSSRWARCAFST